MTQNVSIEENIYNQVNLLDSTSIFNNMDVCNDAESNFTELQNENEKQKSCNCEGPPILTQISSEEVLFKLLF